MNREPDRQQREIEFPPIEEPPLTRATLDYIARATPERRKSLGQFFTPAELRNELLRGIELPPRARVLDPGCGTGEFLRTAQLMWPDAKLHGLEIDPELADIARRAVPKAKVRQVDALQEEWRPNYHAVIGNPPYFEFKPDQDLRECYADVISGRPNTFALFVKLGVEVLRPGGVLAFVLPPSMNNGAYFRGLREYITANCRVESLRVLPSAGLFVGASQTVMLLRLRKGERDDGRHLLRRGPFTLFCEDPAALESLLEGSDSLASLGYDVRTGSVVWNQVRDRLTDDPEKAVRLIWSHDIGDGRLEFQSRPGKPGFVRDKLPLVGPAIVVNRITGTGKSATLRAAVVPTGMEFVGENHVNVVLPPAGASDDDVREVARRLRLPRAAETVRRLTGNTQISSLELKHLVPL